MAANKAIFRFFDAVKKNEINEVKELLNSKTVKVDVKDPNFHDQTALHVAAKKGYNDLIQILVNEFEASVNVQNGYGEIPLQVATDVNNINIVKFLLERNSELQDYAEPYLNEPIIDELFKAAESNDITKIVELVKEQKVDVNSTDKSNHHKTALHIAATNGYEELVHVLVDELHADIQFEDNFGETAKNNAIDNDHPEIAKFLIERGYKDRF